MKRARLQTRFLFAACMIAALLLPLVAPAAELLQPLRRWFDTPGTPKEVIVDSGGKSGVGGDGGVADAVTAVEAWNSAGLVLDAVSRQHKRYHAG